MRTVIILFCGLAALALLVPGMVVVRSAEAEHHRARAMAFAQMELDNAAASVAEARQLAAQQIRDAVLEIESTVAPASPVAPVPPAAPVAKTPSSRNKKPKTKSTVNSTSRPPHVLTVEGGARTTHDEAWKAALEAASRRIVNEYNLAMQLPADEAEAARLITESETACASDIGPDLQRVILTLEIPQSYVNQLGQRERAYRAEGRMLYLTRGLAMIVAALFAVAGYVRLEEWSKGYMSGVWKLLALAGVGAAAAGIWWF